MCPMDPFSDHYRKVLDQTYDVVDRIVLNAYFPLGGSAGGFRHWWQCLHGTTDNLDDTHLMRMADRFSRRVRGWAKKQGVPVIYRKAGERKHRIAEQHLPDDPNFEGIFAVMVNKSPAPVRAVIEAAIALAPAPRGFTASELADEVHHARGAKASYTARQAAYDLKKLRGKGLIEKVENAAHRYQPTPDGLRSMTALIVLRDKVLNPLLTYNGRCRHGSKFDDPEQAELDARYQDVQRQMQQLFKTLRIAA